MVEIFNKVSDDETLCSESYCSNEKCC